jgi:hypothetical protein
MTRATAKKFASTETLMIVRFARTLSPWQFAERHPKAHTIIGHYNPFEQIDEEGTGRPSYFSVFSSVQNDLSLVGDCTSLVHASSATLRLSYALAQDAARVCALVDAVPSESPADCASLAIFRYDRPLYDRLRDLRDERRMAYRLTDPLEALTDRRQTSPIDDDWGRHGAMTTLAGIPLTARPVRH